MKSIMKPPNIPDKTSTVSTLIFVFLATLLIPSITMTADAREHRVGEDHPFKTISAAAAVALPGDTITVHAGIYREWVNPPRGGTSDENRITYQAAKDETVVITGSDPAKGWEKVSGDTWKLVVPNHSFGKFHPYVEKVEGDWFDGQGRNHHRGGVYLDDVSLNESANLDAVKQPGETPIWYAKVDGVSNELPQSLMNVAWFKTSTGIPVPAVSAIKRVRITDQPCSEGGQYAGLITHRSSLRFEEVDFGSGTETVEIRAAAPSGAGGLIELRLDTIEGEILGSSEISVTGGAQEWKTFQISIKKTTGKKTLSVLFKQKPVAKPDPETWGKNTTIWARFPGVNPNEANVEIGVRPTVFTPTKTNIDFITVRGFKLRNAATNWAAPTAGQVGLISAYWNKGWIIENNEISNSRCAGIALGKYSDEWDGKRGTKEGYDLTIDDASKKGGWTKEKIGGHIIRNNHIHHCGQVGIVGSLGCAFSTVHGNVIHDINLASPFGGAEMAGIKFHGAIDVKISHNHIYRCGYVAGIWLDWMCQGAQITGNLMHDNDLDCGDLFIEMQHGPLLVSNNLLLSKAEMYIVSKGIAFAHNLILSPLGHESYDSRTTPFHKPHSTEIAGIQEGNGGDHRFYNNIFVAPAGLQGIDHAVLPCFAAGNVFLKGAKASRFDEEMLLKPDFDCGWKLMEKPDGWYLTITLDPKWRDEIARQLVNTKRLGKAVIPKMAFEEPDGSAIVIETDYQGRQRNTGNPLPGPFENVGVGPVTYKVW
jgi:alpha-N-arabinofuranosidase